MTNTKGWGKMKKSIVAVIVALSIALCFGMAHANREDISIMGIQVEMIDVGQHDHSQDNYHAMTFEYYNVLAVTWYNSTVIVELQNDEKTLYLGAVAEGREILSSIATTALNSKLQMVIGREEDGCITYLNVRRPGPQQEDGYNPDTQQQDTGYRDN
jgi:hypothetical protein